MATQRQIEANRRNAQKSTGPRSVAGKLQSSRNALKHGLASSSPYDAHVVARLKPLETELSKKYPRSSARLVALADSRLVRIREVRAKAWEEIERVLSKSKKSVDVEGLIEGSLRLDRYEKRALSRRKRLLNKLRPKSVAY